MIWVFYFFAAILVLLSAKSLLSGIRYKKYFKRELARPASGYTPLATVFAPCRGIEDGLETNLTSLCLQRYPAYEIIFILDDHDDPAAAVIESVRSVSMVPTKVVIAAKAQNSSQKVQNLREGVLHADSASKVFVFADSDVAVSESWLASLAAPLANDTIGAATGYRWFISSKHTFASEMRSAWNASIASALGPNSSSNFCWGGSMAVRRDLFDSLNIRGKWTGTLSDDFAVTRAMNEAGRPIVLVPAAMAVTKGNCTFVELLEFTTRQMKITRVNAPGLWLMSLFGSAVFNGVLIAAYLLWMCSRTDALARFALYTMFLVTVFSIGKAWLRLAAVRLSLPMYNAQLRRQLLTQNTLWLLVPAVFLYNSIAALLSRKVTWRGTTYKLKSPNETVIITD